MSIGVIVGLGVCVGIFLLARLVAAASRPGRVYPGPGRREIDGGDGMAWTGLAVSTGHPHHSHSDGGFHTGGVVGGDSGGFHTGGFDGGGGGGDGGGGD